MKIFLLVWSVSAFFTPAFGSVGFQQLSVPDPPGKALSVAVWFPSVGKPVSVSVGPFQQMVVPDDTISGTGLPMVLISHGTGGSDGSHYDTALALAGEGFAVVALTHTGDNYIDQTYVGNRKDLTDRPRQVSVVLSYMLTTWTQHDRLDAARVGMFGFSFRRLHDPGGDRGYSGREPDARAVHETPNGAGMPLHKATKWRPVKPGGLHTRLDPRSAGESGSSGCAGSQLLIWAWVPERCANSDSVVAGL